MVNPKLTAVTREPGERALDLPNFIYRIVPAWQQPSWYMGETWRNVVARQPFAVDFRSTLISYVTSLDWRIISRDPSERDERKKEIEYYIRLLESDGYANGLDYTGHVEWLLQDLLDLPFGGASEVGREGDKPEGKVVWIHNIDGSTLFPTLNEMYPVGQRLDQMLSEFVAFPKHAISRIYMSPRPNIQREGWGMAPPEKIFLALEMLWRGDQYYAGMLLDTPTAGILDLGDMEKAYALEWLESWRGLMNGVDAFKIPVLYEHTKDVKYIPFGKPPTDIMFDKITMKYAALVGAGYGMTLSDIGLALSGNGGETLAGSIRDERKTRKSGVATVKRKLTHYFNNILPPHLEFRLIDPDDEITMTTARARLASAQADKILVEIGQFTADELRAQTLDSGLITVPVPEKAPEKPMLPGQTPGANPDTRDLIQRKVPVSSGGQGEIKEQSQIQRGNVQNWLDLEFHKIYTDPRLDLMYRKMLRVVAPKVEGLINRSLVGEDLGAVTEWYTQVFFDVSEEEIPAVVHQAVSDIDEELDRILIQEEERWKLREGNNKELEMALLAAYSFAAQQMIEDMQNYLYERGMAEIPSGGAFQFSNEEKQEELAGYIAGIYASINSGTRYYIRRALIASLREKLSELSEENIDIDRLLDDNTFVSSVLTNLKSRLGEIMRRRAGVISEYEDVTVSRMAQVDVLEMSGLELKRWEALGPNPCENCIWNDAQGYVPMEFVYRASYPEGVLQPLAHSYCHCGIQFSRDEIVQRAVDGSFKIWLGA